LNEYLLNYSGDGSPHTVIAVLWQCLYQVSKEFLALAACGASFKPSALAQ
jgi:hypothetical protein